MPARVYPPKREYLQFIRPYGARIRKLALAVRALVLEEAADATELIYDAYNAVATGYTFTGRPSDAFIHIAVYANWVNIGFNRGSQLEDPQKLLQGSGRWVRHIRIAGESDFKKPAIREFVKAAVSGAIRPSEQEMSKGAVNPRSVVRAIYPRKRRPQRQR